MITERDLQEAIAECEGQRNPNANTCIKLAAFYTIKQHMFPDQGQIQNEPISPTYSYAPADNVISYIGESEFAEKIYGKETDKIISIFDDLMSTLSVLNPKLYNNVMQKIAE